MSHLGLEVKGPPVNTTRNNGFIGPIAGPEKAIHGDSLLGERGTSGNRPYTDIPHRPHGKCRLDSTSTQMGGDMIQYYVLVPREGLSDQFHTGSPVRF